MRMMLQYEDDIQCKDNVKALCDQVWNCYALLSAAIICLYYTFYLYCCIYYPKLFITPNIISSPYRGQIILPLNIEARESLNFPNVIVHFSYCNISGPNFNRVEGWLSHLFGLNSFYKSKFSLFSIANRKWWHQWTMRSQHGTMK